MVLLFAEHTSGEFKKAVFEAATYGHDLAQAMGSELHAISVGHVGESELQQLGKYGVTKVHTVSHPKLDSFVNTAYAAAITAVAQAIGAKAVIMAQTYDGRAVAPRVAVKLNAAALPGLSTLADPASGFDAKRLAFSGKGLQTVDTTAKKVVITVKTNGYNITEHPVALSIEPFNHLVGDTDIDVLVKELVKETKGISLTEADVVVSAGRGMKGPENWGMIEELAALLHAATACSKPTSDMGWRPHHEHVGQTGIQIAPNVYFAIGISGAIQHLAGVSSSKNIIVINKDSDAPFFKIADYGVVGDLFEIVPKLITAIKAIKGV